MPDRRRCVVCGGGGHDATMQYTDCCDRPFHWHRQCAARLGVDASTPTPMGDIGPCRRCVRRSRTRLVRRPSPSPPRSSPTETPATGPTDLVCKGPRRRAVVVHDDGVDGQLSILAFVVRAGHVAKEVDGARDVEVLEAHGAQRFARWGLAETEKGVGLLVDEGQVGGAGVVLGAAERVEQRWSTVVG